MPWVDESASTGQWVDEKPTVHPGMTHTTPPPSDEAISREKVEGLLGAVDWERELPFGTRFDLSQSVPIPEKIAKLKKHFPDKKVISHGEHILLQDEGSDKWYPADSPDTTLADIADAGSEALPLGLGILGAVASGGASIPATAIYSGLGVLMGEIFKEDIESARGFQLQPKEERSKNAAIRGSVDTAIALFTGGLGKGYNMLSGRGLTPPNAAYSRDIGAYMPMIDKGELPIIMPHQALPTGSIANRLSMQGAAFSSHSADLMGDQAEAAAKGLSHIGPNKSAYRSGVELAAEAQAVHKKGLASIRRPSLPANPESAGIATKKGLVGWLDQTKQTLNAAYGKVRSAVDAEQPVFDLSPVSAKMADIGVFGQKIPVEEGMGILTAQGDEFMRQVVPFINVAETPMGKLNRVAYLLGELNPEQMNYEVIKQLRTTVGDVIENAPWNADINTGAAKRLYGVFTDVLENPTTSAPTYTRAIKEASKLAKSRFDMLEKPAVRKIYQTDRVNQLGAEVAQPGGMTPEVRSILKTQPREMDNVRMLGFQNIVNDKRGAKVALDEWKINDPQGYQFLFGKNTKGLNDAAASIDNFNSSNLAQVVKENNRPLQYVRELLLKPGSSRRDTVKLVADLGGRGSRGVETLRAAMLADIVEQSITRGKVGRMVNPKAFQRAVEPYRKTGAWNTVLTEQDRTTLNGLESYVRHTVGTVQDVGTTLEQASAYAKLKHPSTFIQALHAIGVGKFIGSLMMNPNVVKGLVGKGAKGPVSNTAFVSAGLMTEAFGKSIYADPDLGAAMVDYLPGIGREIGTGVANIEHGLRSMLSQDE